MLRYTLVGLVLLSQSPAIAEPTVPATGQPKTTVMVATPMLSSDMSPAVANSLERVFDQAIVAVDAVVADKDLVARKSRSLGVPIAKRSGAVKVASAVGAAAILRYRAKMVDVRIHLRATVFFHETGKAVMLEREVEFRDLGPTTKAMMKELLGAGPQAATPQPATPQSSPAVDPSPAPAAAPTAAVTAATIGNPNAASGLVARFDIGPSVAIGEGSDELTVGPRLGGVFGYQIRLGNIHAITPELAVGLVRWGAEDATDVYGTTHEVSGGLSVFNVMAGIRYDLCLGPVMLWPAVRFGFALASGSLESGGDTYMDDSSAGFVMDFAFGAQYMIVPYFGAGIFFDVIKAFISDLTWVDGATKSSVAAAGFSFGLHLTGKLPL